MRTSITIIPLTTSFIPDPPTMWFHNIRQGDKLKIGASTYTVAGPIVNPSQTSLTTTGFNNWNPERFVNYGPSYVSYPGSTYGGSMSFEFLYLVDSIDNDGDGIVDEGFDGIDNDGDGIIDPGYNGLDDDGNGKVDDWYELYYSKANPSVPYYGCPDTNVNPNFAAQMAGFLANPPTLFPNEYEPEGRGPDCYGQLLCLQPGDLQPRHRRWHRIPHPPPPRPLAVGAGGEPAVERGDRHDHLEQHPGAVSPADRPLLGQRGHHVRTRRPRAVPGRHRQSGPATDAVLPLLGGRHRGCSRSGVNPSYPTAPYPQLPVDADEIINGSGYSRITYGSLEGERRLVTVNTKTGHTVTNAIEAFDLTDPNYVYEAAQAGSDQSP